MYKLHAECYARSESEDRKGIKGARIKQIFYIGRSKEYRASSIALVFYSCTYRCFRNQLQVTTTFFPPVCKARIFGILDLHPLAEPSP